MALVGVGRNQSHIVGVILYGSSISTVTTVPPTAWSLRFWTLPWCYHSGRAETTHVARLPSQPFGEERRARAASCGAPSVFTFGSSSALCASCASSDGAASYNAVRPRWAQAHAELDAPRRLFPNHAARRYGAIRARSASISRRRCIRSWSV